MGYNIVTIRSGDDADDDALYPNPSAEGSQWVAALTQADGSPATFVASGLEVSAYTNEKTEKVLSLSDVKIEVLVTDSRLVIGCAKYDKGGGWTGIGAGALVAVAANGVSKALAARRRRGKVLVGQIRYPWLVSVGGSRKQGWLDSEQLRATARRPQSEGGGNLGLTLKLDKHLNSSAIAREVIHRAAAWRLAHDVVTDADEERTLRELLDASELAPQPKRFSMYTLPTSYPATASTAFPKRDADGGPATRDGDVPSVQP